MPRQKIKIHIIIFINLICFKILGFTTHHFYRASYLPNEPRFENSCLSTVQIQTTGGTARSSFNKFGKKCDLFAYDNNLVCQTNCLNGKFELFEANFNFFYNVTPNIYLELYIPVRNSVTISDFIQPLDSNCLKNVTNYFMEHNPRTSATLKKSGLADCALLAGWTINYQDTEFFDYIDASFQIGVLFPTAKQKNPLCPIDFSFGYGRHWGLPIVLDASIGVYEWLTCGIHFDSVFLLSKHRRDHLINNANSNAGNIFGFSTYLKADHLLKGISAAIGFTYARKNHNKNFCNTDPALHKWSVASFNFLAEYDFSEDNYCIGPKFAIIVNLPIAGKNVIRTPLTGLMATVDVSFKY